MRKPRKIKEIDASVQRRLDILEKLIDSDYEGKPSVFEKKTGVRMAQVGQWFSGATALRENAVKRLEEKTKKPEGFFDGPVHHALTGEPGVYELSSRKADDEFSPLAKLLARLFDKIPEADDIGRSLAFNAASVEIHQVLSKHLEQLETKKSSQ